MADFNVGKFDVFTEDQSDERLMKVLMASVSYAGISPAQELDDQLYLSGQVIKENDVMSLINHCENLGYKQSQIVIDTIFSGPNYATPYDD